MAETLIPYTPDLVTEQHIGWLNDKMLMRFSEQRHLTHTMESQRDYLGGLPPESSIWLIRGGDNDVGTISAHIDTPNNTANMGILIGVQGRGYGIGAWRQVMRWLRVKGVRKAECGCMRSNANMVRLALLAGMQQEATIPCHFMLDGKPEDMFLFGVVL